MLKNGTNVYLPKQNPIYIFLKNVGVNIFSIEDDLSEDHLYFYRPTQSEILKNTTILNTYFSAAVDDITVKSIIHHFN